MKNRAQRAQEQNPDQASPTGTACLIEKKLQGGSKINQIPGVEFFISLGFAEPTTHVIQAHFYI